MSARVDYFSQFDTANHFRPPLKWSKINKLKGSDFLWEILEPISDMIEDHEYEEERARRLSPSQKALHFFWYLDGQVTNGGFIQFYWNGYEVYMPSIKKGLKLVQHKELLKVVTGSEKEYDKHIKEFKKWRKKEDWEWLYDNLKKFEKLDDWYYSKEKEHYTLFEKYVRDNIDDFIIKSK